MAPRPPAEVSGLLKSVVSTETRLKGADDRRVIGYVGSDGFVDFPFCGPVSGAHPDCGNVMVGDSVNLVFVETNPGPKID